MSNVPLITLRFFFFFEKLKENLVTDVLNSKLYLIQGLWNSSEKFKILSVMVKLNF